MTKLTSFLHAGNYDRALMIEAHANDESGVSEKTSRGFTRARRLDR